MFSGDKVASEPKEKRNLLNTIRLPLVSVCPLKKKDEQDGKRAGLASMETLGDKSGDETMKEVALDVSLFAGIYVYLHS